MIFNTFDMMVKRFLFIYFLVLQPCVVLCQISIPQWVNGIGGSGSNSVPSGVITDNENNIYVTGTFSGLVDFDATSGVKNLSSNGDFDVYVAKYTTAGVLIWAVSMGGSGLDQESSNMAIDDNGNITIGGLWSSPTMDVDPGPAVFNLQNSGDIDGFIVHLDKDGKFLWGKSIGSSGKDIIHKVATDKNGNVIAIGQFQGTLSLGSNLSAPSGGTNGMTLKFSSSGNLLWAVNTGEGGYNETRGIAIDMEDNVIVSGAFNGNINFNPLGSSQTINGGASSTFVAKYNSSGILNWVKSVAGNIVNNNTFLCVDQKNDVYLSAPFNSNVTFSPTISLSKQGNQDIFLAKYSGNGECQWGKGIGGAGATTYNYGIIISKDNYIYCSGFFNGSVDFNPSTSVNKLTNSSGQDFFLGKYDTDGNYRFAFSAGNPGCNQAGGRNLAIDSNNDVLLVGSYCSNVNFSAVTCAPYPMVARSSRESFLAKYTLNVSAAQITTFSIPEMISSNVDQVNLKIAVNMPSGTNLSALTPTINTSGGVLNPASGVIQNFTDPVVYMLNTGCTSLNYLVTVVTTSAVKKITICSGSLEKLAGDLLNPDPGIYLWEVLQGNSWTSAPGASTGKDYITSAFSNTTNSNLTISVRRKVTNGSLITYDSIYDVTIEPVIAFNNATAPTQIKFDAASDPEIITGSLPTGGVGNYVFQWQSSIDNLNFNNLINATSKDFNPPFISVTTYYKRLVTSGACAVSQSNIIAIQIGSAVEPTPTNPTNLFFVPNAFTPNGDGNNDIFYVYHPSIKILKLLIYDQWGNKLFESKNQSSGWNGTYKGATMPFGVYAYYIEAILEDEQKVHKKGTFTLMK